MDTRREWAGEGDSTGEATARPGDAIFNIKQKAEKENNGSLGERQKGMWARIDASVALTDCWVTSGLGTKPKQLEYEQRGVCNQGFTT